MPVPSISGSTRLTKTHKISAAGIAAAAAATLAFTAVPGHAEGATAGGGPDLNTRSAAEPASWSSPVLGDKARKGVEAPAAPKRLRSDGDAKKAAAEALKKRTAAAVADKAAKAKAAKERTAKQAANRSTERKAVARTKAAANYPDNLEGWIREALSIMKSKGIPGSYSGIHRNVIRESGGNARAVNDWDVNAANGVPSKGLLQMIEPTFRANHVDGTAWNIYDPVANIAAACNYAAHRYGSMDNVDSAY